MKIKKIKILGFAYIFILFSSFFLNLMLPFLPKIQPYEKSPFELSISAYCIVINGNTELAANASSGFGNVTHPYVIENYDISPAPVEAAISIKNTTAYFIIKNCTITYGGVGANVAFVLENVTNGRVENNTLDECSECLLLTNSFNNIIRNNSFLNTGFTAIYISDNSRNNTIEKNRIIYGFSYGIQINSNSDNNTIFNNTITNFNYGIYVFGTSNNIIKDCTIVNATSQGIRFYQVTYGIIRNNTIDICDRGIYFYESDHNIIFNNSITRANHLIYLNWMSMNNTIDDNFLSDTGGTDTGKAVMFEMGCINNTVINNVISNEANSGKDIGVMVFTAERNNIINNSINEFQVGVRLVAGYNATIENNNISNNMNGIQILYSDFLNITRNNIYNNTEHAIIGEESDKNTIEYNQVSNNSRVGIYCLLSNDSVIKFNNLSYNGWVGVNLSSCSNITVYSNDFYGNNLAGVQGFDAYNNSENFWDNNSLGNYWDDYISRYPTANQVGLYWDIPYNISGNSNTQDEFPLIKSALLNNDFAPNLTSGTVTPSTGNQSILYNFTVNYTDQDNNAPIYVNVLINGTPYLMIKQNQSDFNYTNGCLYQFLRYLQSGNYNYSFVCSDGGYINTTQNYTDLSVSETNIFDPELQTPEVTPEVGRNSTLFNFTVIYFDADNNFPSSINITINSTTSEMQQGNLSDFNCMDGVEYLYNTSLSEFGNYEFQVNCSDGTNSNSTNWISGPEVHPFSGINNVTLLSPSNESQRISGLINFTWQSLELAEIYSNYTIQVSNTSDFSHIYYEYNDIQETTINTTQQINFNFINDTYYWHVRPTYEKYQGNWSDPFILYNDTNFSPTLMSTQVFPEIEQDDASFNFTTFYYDVDNDLPDFINITINNGTHNFTNSMSPVNPLDVDATDGICYYYNTTLDYGYYQFLINCSDIYYLVTTNWINAPEVNPFYGELNISLVSPANETIDFAGWFNFTWESLDIDGIVINYTLQLSNVSDFTQIIHQVDEIIETPVFTNKSVYIDFNSSQYFWRIRPNYEPFIGNWSETFILINETNDFTPQLISPQVTPEIGKGLTVFNFTVWYFDADNNYPYYMNLTINDTTYSMAPVDPFDMNATDGILYHYNNAFPFGYYQFQVNCSDYHRINNTNWVNAPEVNPFYGEPNVSLVSPANETIDFAGWFNFTWESLELFGITLNYTLQISNMSDFSHITHQVDEIIEIPNFTNYSVYIDFNSSQYYWRVRPIYEWFIGNWSETFILINETNDFNPYFQSTQVSPEIGGNSTLYNFTTWYFDADNNTPTSINITINSSIYSMLPGNPLDENYTDGALYYYTTTLVYAYYQFQINISDGFRDNSTGWINAPESNPFFDATILPGSHLIVINEICSSPDYIEMYNYGPDQDMTGWYILEYLSSTLENTYYFPAGWVFKENYVVVLHENSGTNSDTDLYTGWNIGWGSSGIAVGLFDNTDSHVDWVQVSTFTGSRPSDVEWDPDVTLGMQAYRNSDEDTNKASDWSYSGVSSGSLNPGQTGTRSGGFNLTILEPLSPSNESLHFSGSINFTWTCPRYSIGCVNYTLQVSNVSDFSTQYFQIDNIPEGTDQANISLFIDFSGNNSYYWRVCPTYGPFNGNWSDYFIINNRTNDYYPQLISPQVSPTIGNTTTIYNFTIWYYDADNNYPFYMNITINDTTYSMIPVNPLDLDATDGILYSYATMFDPGYYTFQVNCSDYHRTNNTNWINAPEVNPFYGTQLNLLNPINQTIDFAGWFNFTWQSLEVPNATVNYTLQISNTSDFSQITHEIADIQETYTNTSEYIYIDFSTSQKFWRVRPISQYFIGNWSDTYILINETNDFTPFLLSPQVSPELGGIYTYFNFTVRYFDLDNNSPVWINITINSTSYSMLPVDIQDINYIDGVLYYYLTRLNIGNNQFQINCSDGHKSNYTDWIDGPELDFFNGVNYIVINEISTNSDYIELYNYGPDQDMTGWYVEFYDNSILYFTYYFPNGWIFDENHIIVLMESYGTNSDTILYLNQGLPWNGDGLAVGLFDNGNNSIDWFETSDFIGSKPSDALWEQDASILLFNNYASRFNDFDSDSASDWKVLSTGTPNSLYSWQLLENGLYSSSLVRFQRLNYVSGGWFTFIWDDIGLQTHTTYYIIQISNDPGFSNIIYEQDKISGLGDTMGISIQLDLAPGQYYYRIRPYSGNNFGSWTDSSTLSISSTNYSSNIIEGLLLFIITFGIVGSLVTSFIYISSRKLKKYEEISELSKKGKSLGDSNNISEDLA